jgi:hypothetical protein
MMSCFKILFLPVFLLLGSCATNYIPYYLNEIVVRNSTIGTLTDVRIQSRNTGRMFSCGNVAPGAHCSDTFPARPYQNSRISISWTYNEQRTEKTDFQPEVPATMDKSLPLRGVLEIKSRGKFSVYFEQSQKRF